MFDTSTISLSMKALNTNLDFVRGQLNGARLCSVVKGNAYGHGFDPFVRMAIAAGVDYFAVYAAEEALHLTKLLGKNPDLFIMGMVEGDAVEWAIEEGIEFCVFDMDRLDTASQLAAKLKKKARLHIEVETGMNRTGFDLTEMPEVLGKLKQNVAHIDLKGVFTHFSGAESNINDQRVRAQIALFERARLMFEREGIRPESAHQACSAAVMNYPGTIGNMARVGIMQYGFWSNQETWLRYSMQNDTAIDPLRRLITWKSRVMSVKSVKAGDLIGYGTSCEAQRDMHVAVIPVGYAHGFTRGLSNYGQVLIRSQKARVAGIVNMNAITVDVTEVEGVEKGDEVVLIGHQDGHSISVSSFSEMSEQLNYEMLTRLPQSIPRSITD